MADKRFRLVLSLQEIVTDNIGRSFDDEPNELDNTVIFESGSFQYAQLAMGKAIEAAQEIQRSLVVSGPKRRQRR